MRSTLKNNSESNPLARRGSYRLTAIISEIVKSNPVISVAEVKSNPVISVTEVHRMWAHLSDSRTETQAQIKVRKVTKTTRIRRVNLAKALITEVNTIVILTEIVVLMGVRVTSKDAHKVARCDWCWRYLPCVLRDKKWFCEQCRPKHEAMAKVESSVIFQQQLRDSSATTKNRIKEPEL